MYHKLLHDELLSSILLTVMRNVPPPLVVTFFSNLFTGDVEHMVQVDLNKQIDLRDKEWDSPASIITYDNLGMLTCILSKCKGNVNKIYRKFLI